MKTLRLRHGSQIMTELGTLTFYHYTSLRGAFYATFKGEEEADYMETAKLREFLKGYGLEYDEIVWEEVVE